VNKQRIDRFLRESISVVGREGQAVAVLGLAFKANPTTSDSRRLGSREAMLEEGAVVHATDRKRCRAPRLSSPGSITGPLRRLREADAALICTEWDVFRNWTGPRRKVMARKLVIDGRNLYPPQACGR